MAILYHFTDIYNLLHEAGWPKASYPIATGIILAESGGNPIAINTNKDGSKDRGLWQINNKAHPDVSDACAFNPVCATKAALRISNGGKNFKPWVTFNNGSARKAFIKANEEDAAHPSKIGFGDVIGMATDDVGGVASAVGNVIGDAANTLNPIKGIEAVGKFFLDLWSFGPRFAKILFGAVLVVLGLNALNKELTGTDVLGDAGKAAAVAAV